MLKGVGEEVEKDSSGNGESEKEINAVSKIWLKRSLSGESSMTLIKQRKPWYLERQGVNNIWCGKGFDSYVEGAFKNLQGLLILLSIVMKVKSSYHQILGATLFHYMNIEEGTKEFLDTKESIVCSKAVLPKPILGLVKSTSRQYSTNLIFLKVS